MTLMSSVSKARTVIREVVPDLSLRRYKKHNRKIFTHKMSEKRRSPVVLMELNTMCSSHIAYSYLANVVAANNNARIVGFSIWPKRGLRYSFLSWLKELIGSGQYGAYKSFGVTEFLSIAPSRTQKAKAKTIFDQLIPTLSTTREIEELKINGVWVGDLVYDSYLKACVKPTIDPNSNEFRDFLLDSIGLFVVWSDYLDSHDVRAINVSHCVYNLAMPLRLAIHRNIPVYQASITHMYRLTKHNLFAYNDFFYFPELFASLPLAVQKAGCAEAKKRIERRFAGEVGVDMAYSTKSAFGEIRQERLIRETQRPKILIATHCFFDSPHSYGNNLFPDFYEWLDFLGKMTEETECDWYIKTHPDFLPDTEKIILSLVAKYPKFTLLPSSASHKQIIAEGINVALTVYGTIGFEYAALGIPVINASKNNPHTAYDFNIHSDNLEEYRGLIENIERIDCSIDRNKIYEYYFMRYVYNTENIFFENYNQVIDELGGYYQQFGTCVYDKWIDEWTLQRHELIMKALQAYIQSGDFRMDHKHFGVEYHSPTA